MPKFEQMPQSQKTEAQPEEIPAKRKERLALRVFKKLRDKPGIASIVEKEAVPRAIDLLEKTKIKDYLKENGVYSDIGSGLGHIAEQVVKEGYDKNVKILPFDIEWTPAKKLTKRMAKEGIREKALFMKADATAQPIADNSLDGALLYFVLHHMPKDIQQKTLDEIKRTLKKDGRLFFVEDVAENKEEAERVQKWDARVNAEWPDEPHYYRKREEWLKFLDENGFELIDEADFEDDGKKNEGIIRHKSYILQHKAKN